MVIWLALLGMICWGIAPIFAKLGLQNINPSTGLLLRTMIAVVLVSTWMGVSGGITQFKQITLQQSFLIAAEAILATVLGDLAYFAAIKAGDVSVISMIMAASPLVTMIGAAFFLEEPITVFKCLGAGYIILGIWLIL
ncbi:MAG TPA: EamA family transporter [Syntrophomonadaceae bacterium]|nr:EamA family transporter [Syntrophomonadaceae bacterium]